VFLQDSYHDLGEESCREVALATVSSILAAYGYPTDRRPCRVFGTGHADLTIWMDNEGGELFVFEPLDVAKLLKLRSAAIVHLTNLGIDMVPIKNGESDV
jgi:hypothetical protein